MITCEKGLSRYIMYYWYNHIDEPRWYTKDEILNIKEKIDKKYKRHLIKFWSLLLAFLSLIIGFCCFCIILSGKVSEGNYFYICGLVRLPFIIIVPCFTILFPHLDETFLYKRKDFYKTFGTYFKDEGLKSYDFK